MNSKQSIISLGIGALFCLSALAPVHAAISLDRTRIVFDGGKKAVSLSVTNNNQKLPYLAQGWIEDTEGKKIQAPLTVLPPIQRIEPGSKSQVKIQGLPSTASLQQDRETLYYFNLREIPPRSNKPNTLQLALQTKVKLFYRPESIYVDPNAAPVQNALTLTRQGNKYIINNPTPYYITIVEARSVVGGKPVSGFNSLLLAPKSDLTLTAEASKLGANPVLTYINDYGGRPQIQFTCKENKCSATEVKNKS